jgi:hypothetical protein
MKTIGIAKCLVLLTGVILSVSCDENEPTRIETVTEILTAGTWLSQSATVDNVAQPNYLSDLQIDFSPHGMSVLNGDPIFSSQDSWMFTDDTATAITTGSGLELELVEVTDVNLVLRFFWGQDTFDKGRVKSVAGEHVLTLLH